MSDPSHTEDRGAAYVQMLKEFLAAERNGAEYCRAYAMTFVEGSTQRQQMELLASLEGEASGLIKALLPKGLGAQASTRGSAASMPPLTTQWDDMLAMGERAAVPAAARRFARNCTGDRRGVHRRHRSA